MNKPQEETNKDGCLLFAIFAIIFITFFWAIPGGIDSVATGGSFWEGVKGLVGFNLLAVIVGAIIYLFLRN